MGCLFSGAVSRIFCSTFLTKILGMVGTISVTEDL